jgi:hypothetical protein
LAVVPREAWPGTLQRSLPWGCAAVTDAGPFALVLLLTAVVGLVVVLSDRLTERVANKFAIRHQNRQQLSAYDPAFLD